MKTDLVIAGVGGQGILSISTVIGLAAVSNNLNIKQSEVRGMSQRGGAVYVHLRISDKQIASDLIPLQKADLVLSVEPMEALRYVPFLSQNGWLVTNTNPFVNIGNYPDRNKLMEQLTELPNRILIDADGIAAECGSTKVSNTVTLGAAAPFINIELKELEKAIVSFFEQKGDEVVSQNIQALHTGYAMTRKAAGN